MKKERLARLDALGFDWDSREIKLEREWTDKFNELLSFKKEYGHCRVPKKVGIFVSDGIMFRLFSSYSWRLLFESIVSAGWSSRTMVS